MHIKYDSTETTFSGLNWIGLGIFFRLVFLEIIYLLLLHVQKFMLKNCRSRTKTVFTIFSMFRIHKQVSIISLFFVQFHTKTIRSRLSLLILKSSHAWLMTNRHGRFSYKTSLYTELSSILNLKTLIISKLLFFFQLRFYSCS